MVCKFVVLNWKIGFIFYILPKSNHTEMFRVAKPKSNKLQKLSNDNETYLWHLRLGHISLDRINRLTKDGPLKDLNVGSLPVCESV